MRKTELELDSINKMLDELSKMLDNWMKNQEEIDKEIKELENRRRLRNQQRNEAEKLS